MFTDQPQRVIPPVVGWEIGCLFMVDSSRHLPSIKFIFNLSLQAWSQERQTNQQSAPSPDTTREDTGIKKQNVASGRIQSIKLIACATSYLRRLSIRSKQGAALCWNSMTQVHDSRSVVARSERSLLLSYYVAGVLFSLLSNIIKPQSTSIMGLAG